MSHTGPKTSRAARDRPEPNPRRIQTSRHDIAGDSLERRRRLETLRATQGRAPPDRRASSHTPRPTVAQHLATLRPASKRAAALRPSAQRQRRLLPRRRATSAPRSGKWPPDMRDKRGRGARRARPRRATSAAEASVKGCRGAMRRPISYAHG
ncbi:hypothetical protein F511_29048 [Dorcoceras hygrometricum]|uniref:Uncharacterized protein n=1 Tax=Dorcoceras hygrometricum TaxID=472368 RepID=A0A2Z7CC06_9LAMI|nr:hypothetical protein F511_29048 [Dorcoceras hygrometricum]